MKWLLSITKLDRRWIFLVVALAALVPTFHPLGLPIGRSAEAQKFFDLLQAVPEGSKVLISCDYAPSGAPELDPMLVGMARQLLTRKCKIYLMGLWDQGPRLGTSAIEKVKKDFPQIVYGVDWCNLGFKTGGYAVEIAMASQPVTEVFPEDVNGAKTKDLPMMQGLGTIKDFAIVLSLTGGNNGLQHVWVPFGNSKDHLTVAGGCTSVSGPSLTPYVQAGQIAGLLVGIKSAAEYERLLNEAGMKNALGAGVTSMDVQSIIHLVIMAFVILANISYFLEKKAAAAEEGAL